MNANESAFPSHGSMGEVVQTGLTKREYFAGLAMQGMAMRATSLIDIDVAYHATRLADALLAELEKSK